MTGSEPEWRRHADGRWVIGDEGAQADVVALPSTTAPGRPDTVLDGARIGVLEYRAVSLRGLSHQTAGKPRQDAYAVRVTRGGTWLTGCVADGVSEGQRSDIAADLASREIAAVLADASAALVLPDEPGDWERLHAELPWQGAADQARAAILGKAAALVNTVSPDADALGERDLARLMSTTAIAFVVSTIPIADGLVPYAVASMAGDSSAFQLSCGEWCSLTEVKNESAEIASSSVSPLPLPVEVRAVCGFLRAGDVLAVMTDGLGDPLGGGTGVVGRFLAEMWARPPQLFTFAEHVAFYRKTYTDDKTAVTVWVLEP